MIDCIYNDRRKWCFNPDVRKPWFRKKRCCIYSGGLCKHQVIADSFFSKIVIDSNKIVTDAIAEWSIVPSEVLSRMPRSKQSAIWWSPLNETKKGWGVMEETKNNYILTEDHGFWNGTHCKAIQFDLRSNADIPFMLGYCLWGLDIWIDRAPMIKLMVFANIVNMAIMWILKG
jgi:hypothetical protein